MSRAVLAWEAIHSAIILKINTPVLLIYDNDRDDDVEGVVVGVTVSMMMRS